MHKLRQIKVLLRQIRESNHDIERRIDAFDNHVSIRQDVKAIKTCVEEDYVETMNSITALRIANDQLKGRACGFEEWGAGGIHGKDLWCQ